jgi:hypothetical protein
MKINYVLCLAAVLVGSSFAFWGCSKSDTEATGSVTLKVQK